MIGRRRPKPAHTGFFTTIKGIEHGQATREQADQAAKEQAAKEAAKNPGFFTRLSNSVRDSVNNVFPKTVKPEEQPLPSDRIGGGKKAGSKCVSTGKKITFTRNGKMVTRIIHEHSNGSKCVKYNDNWVPLSKLKI
jgi:hypothetical protein